MTPGEREQRVLENLEVWAARGDAHIRQIARIQVAKLLPGALVAPPAAPAHERPIPVRRGKWLQL